MASKKEDLVVQDVVLSNLKTREEFEVLLESGAIPPGVDTPEKLMTIIQLGKELGISPMVSITSINVIKGRAVVSSSILGALLKNHGIEWIWTKDFFTETDGKINTELEFQWVSKVFNKPKSAKFSISWAQMKMAGYTEKSNWIKYPKEMMRARAMAYGVRALFPEILLGSVYTADEMNDAQNAGHRTEVTEEGEVTIVQGNED
tara:strand:- start:3229 stop:3840 length:612 start_codon:yes stop_codon:yes gene_type:complete